MKKKVTGFSIQNFKGIGGKQLLIFVHRGADTTMYNNISKSSAKRALSALLKLAGK